MLRQIVAKATTQTIVAVLLIVTLCYLAVIGAINPELFVGVVLAAVAWLYPRSSATK